jgi:murein DD-endopeptidase MepM/ murein hydrolase activator NlpD
VAGGRGRWLAAAGTVAVLVPASVLLVHLATQPATAPRALAPALSPPASSPPKGAGQPQTSSSSVQASASVSSVAASGTASTASATASIPVTVTAGQAPAPAQPVPPTPPISTYTVQPGDTLWAIAQRFGTDVASLEAANDLGSSGVIHVGQSLTVVNQVGWVWTVQSGQSLSAIAASTGVAISQIEQANGLSTTVLQPGQKLLIPGEPSAAQVTGTAAPTSTPTSNTALPGTWVVQSGDTLSGIAVAEGVTLSALEAANGLTWSSPLHVGEVITVPGRGPGYVVNPGHILLSWPVATSYPITSPFGWRPNPWGPGTDFHFGIDIGVPLMTPVHAACSGVVKVASWITGFRGGYGNAVEIQCNLGPLTLYAHNTKLLVSVGQKVTRGQVISDSGSTGNSTGPHLHFGVQVNGTWENPRDFLPPR